MNRPSFRTFPSNLCLSRARAWSLFAVVLASLFLGVPCYGSADASLSAEDAWQWVLEVEKRWTEEAFAARVGDPPPAGAPAKRVVEFLVYEKCRLVKAFRTPSESGVLKTFHSDMKRIESQVSTLLAEHPSLRPALASTLSGFKYLRGRHAASAAYALLAIKSGLWDALDRRTLWACFRVMVKNYKEGEELTDYRSRYVTLVPFGAKRVTAEDIACWARMEELLKDKSVSMGEILSSKDPRVRRGLSVVANRIYELGRMEGEASGREAVRRLNQRDIQLHRAKIKKRYDGWVGRLKSLEKLPNSRKEITSLIEDLEKAAWGFDSLHKESIPNKDAIRAAFPDSEEAALCDLYYQFHIHDRSWAVVREAEANDALLDDPRGLYIYAKALMAEHMDEKASRALEQLLNKQPDDAWARRMLDLLSKRSPAGRVVPDVEE